jgi:hypothetical protein
MATATMAGTGTGEWRRDGTTVYTLNGPPEWPTRWSVEWRACPETPLAEVEAVARLMRAAPKLLAALRGIIEIGKRDMSNPKYDGYFDEAREAIAEAE